MAKITHHLHAEIDLSQPVPELCAVIAAVLQAWTDKEREVLTKLQEAIEEHLKVIDKEEADKRGKSLR
jgi:hypothetical protein